MPKNVIKILIRIGSLSFGGLTGLAAGQLLRSSLLHPDFTPIMWCWIAWLCISSFHLLWLVHKVPANFKEMDGLINKLHAEMDKQIVTMLANELMTVELTERSPGKTYDEVRNYYLSRAVTLHREIKAKPTFKDVGEDSPEVPAVFKQ